MRMYRLAVVTMIMVSLCAASLSASALLVTCDVGGATLEKYNENTHRFERVAACRI